MSKKGISGLALVVLIVIILAVIIMIVFITPIRTVVITELASIGKGIGLAENGTQTTGGGGGNGNNQLFIQSTNFTAYNCSGSATCIRFTDNVVLWYVNFNSENLSASVTKNITFSSHPGNYIYRVYNFTQGAYSYCSNVSLRTATAGSTYTIYYFQKPSSC